MQSLEGWFHLKSKKRTITKDNASRVIERKPCYPMQTAGIQESSSASLQTSPTTLGNLFKPLCFCFSTRITAGTKLTLRMYFETSVIIPKCFEKCYVMQVKNAIIKIVLQKSSLTRICFIAKTAPKPLLACKSQSSHRHRGERHRQELRLYCKGWIQPHRVL